MRARVPVDPDTLEVWEPRAGDGTSVKIAGVPGEALGIEVEMPLPEPEEGANEMSVEGSLKTVLEGHEVRASFVPPRRAS